MDRATSSTEPAQTRVLLDQQAAPLRPRQRSIGSPHVPSAYLRKWQTWLQMLGEACEAEALIIMRRCEGPDPGLKPVIESCHRAPELLPQLRQAALLWGSKAIATRGPVQAEPQPGMGCHLALPLCWPDKNAYGSLSLFIATPRSAAMLHLLGLVRELIEADFRCLHFVRAIDEHKDQLEARIADRTEELSRVNGQLARELSLSQRTSEVLRQMVIGVPGSGGQSYFRQLVRQLALLLKADQTFVALLSTDPPGQARTIACYDGETWQEKFEYPLADTPCAEVVRNMSLLMSSDLARDFPRTNAHEQGRSYIGAPLLNDAGRVVGVLAALGGPGMVDAHLAREIMDLLAARTGTEIRRLRAEDELRRMALQDELTALPNRNNFKDRLHQALAQTQRDGSQFALLFVDLDNFKTINDSLGHDVGDAVLMQFARLLNACMREMDTIARLGGDEFAVLLPGVDSLQVDAVCRRIMAALRQPLTCQGHELFVSASIGCCLYPEDGEDSVSLIRAADAAMYRAKGLGKNQFQFYALDIKQAIQRDLMVGNRLRKAIQARGLHLVYQPKIALGDRRMAGAEVLCRWADSELGPVSPAEFIPVAERSGVISDLGTLVIELVIQDLLCWRARGLALPAIAINVSAKQLKTAGFAEWLSDLLCQHGLAPSQLVIELTEGVLMERSEANQQLLVQLVGYGFRVSVDDFGTGYSSLAYLKRMPISELKIDRSFVRHIATDPDDQAIAAAILTLAHTLNLSVVAEGVEDEQQLEVLRALGCDVVQGYFFHQPLDPADFCTLLSSQQ